MCDRPNTGIKIYATWVYSCLIWDSRNRRRGDCGVTCVVAKNPTDTEKRTATAANGGGVSGVAVSKRCPVGRYLPCKTTTT